MSKMIPKSTLGGVSGHMKWTVLLAGMMLFLAACGPAVKPEAMAPTPVMESDEITEPEQGPDLQIDESAYPPPVEAPVVEEAYPVEPIPLPSPTEVPDSYPAVEEVYAEPRFRIDAPVAVSDGVVTGQAPPDLALAIVDISSGGVMLGSGVTTADGQFSIGVSGLPDGHLVGITFSELQPGKTHADMSQEYFPHRGEGFMNIPNIGIFFDTAVVAP